MKTRPLLWLGLGLLGLGTLSLLLRPSPALQPVAEAFVRTSVPPVDPVPAPAPASDALPIASPAAVQPSADVIASGWHNPAASPFIAFREWTARYLAAPPEERAALLPAGVTAARERRAALAALIRRDPRAALAAAVPVTVRQELPAEIVDLLEERVNGRGELALNAVTPLAGKSAAEPVFRSALVNGREYRAYVYGRRASQTTVTSASLVGIAIDGSLAVSESPLRFLEAGESTASLPVVEVCAISGKSAPLAAAAPVAVQYDGRVQALCDPTHAAILAERLRATERQNTADAANNQAGSSGVVGRPTYAWTHGTKKLLLIRVDFSDLPGTPVNSASASTLTEDSAVNLINGSGGVRDYYMQTSYGQTTLQLGAAISGDSPDVTPVLRLPRAASYYAVGDGSDAYNSTLHDDARAAALSAGFDAANYDRVGVVFSYLGNLPSSKINYGGLGNVTGKNFWINGWYNLTTVAHELGHTYGLMHSNLWQVSDGNPVSLTGTSVEYGDGYDVMGSGSNFTSEFSHWNKSILQWIPDTAVTLAAASGTFRIYRFDASAADLTKARALKIVRDPTRDYWIGYRRSSGNASLNGGAYVLWGYNVNQQANLLDMTTPGSGIGDAALAIGTTFNDSAAGIALKPVAQGGSGAEEWLDVQVTLQPRVQWSRSTYTVDEQRGSATLTLSRTMNSSGAVSVNYATVAGTASAPADFTATSGTVSWSDGDVADKTVTITLVADAVTEGAENFTVALSGITGGVVGGNATATVTIADAGVSDPGFDALRGSRVEKVLPLPDGSILCAGWAETVYDAAYSAYSRRGLARVTATGQLDPAFAAGGGADTTPVYDLARQPDGKIIAVGDFTAFSGTSRGHIVRLLADGSVDPSFNPGTGANGSIHAVLAQPDGKIVVGGSFTSFNGVAREYLARLNADGSLDTSFVGPDFGGTSGWLVVSLALQPDGKLLVGGCFYFGGSATFKAGICRVQGTGALDPAFNGVTNGAHVAGSTNQLSYINKIVVQPDGQILIAGDFTAFNNVTRGGVARLAATGALDSGFVTAATFTSGGGRGLLLQADGKIVVGGSFATFNGNSVNNLVRLSSTGSLDTAFLAPGGSQPGIFDLAMQPDGGILLGSDWGKVQGSADGGTVWRLFSGLSALPGTLQFTSASAVGLEGNTLVLSVSRTGGSLGVLTAGYATTAGTAGAADFTGVQGTLTWSSGDTAAKTISIPIAADALSESVENFTVSLGEPLVGPSLLGSPQQVSVSISESIYASFVNKAFSRILNRAASGNDVANVGAQMAAGRTARQVVDDLLASSEYQSRQWDRVIRLYYATFGRMPDYSGLYAWSETLRSGAQTAAQVGAAFASSAEFTATYGSLSNGQFVQQIYRNVLGREADVGGLATWTGALDGGMTRGALLLAFADSAEFRARVTNAVIVVRLFTLLYARVPTDTELLRWTDFLRGADFTDLFLTSGEFQSRFPSGLTQAQYVDLMFQGFLRRGVDSAGLAALAGQLNASQTTRARLLCDIFDSAEFNAIVSPVTRFYLACLNRVPDTSGLDYWTYQVRAGTSLTQLAQAFAGSDEFATRYGGLSNSQFVTQLYHDTLARTPDANGLNYWTNQLATGADTRASMLLNFANSDEAIDRFDPNIRTFLHYLTFLQRNPSTDELNLWENYLITLEPQLTEELLASGEF